MKQALDMGLVDFFGPGPFKLLQGFDLWEAGHVYAPLCGAVAFEIGFACHKLFPIMDMAPFLILSVSGQGFIILTHESEFEVFEFFVYAFYPLS